MSQPSPIGVLSFPHLWKPRKPHPSQEERYSVSVIFDQDAQNSPAFKAMKAAIVECARAKWGADADVMIRKGEIRLPIRDATEKAKYQGYDEGKVFINPWSMQKPDVIDGRLQDVIESDMYPGAKGRVTYNPFAYDNAGNKGIALGLNNVQVADFTTPRLDGRAKGADDFDALDDAPNGGAPDDDDDFPF